MLLHYISQLSMLSYYHLLFLNIIINTYRYGVDEKEKGRPMKIFIGEMVEIAGCNVFSLRQGSRAFSKK